MQLVRAGEPTGAGQLVLYSRETFEGEKFHKFCGFVAIRKKFSLQNLGRGILSHGKSEQSAKVFSTKIVFFNNSRNFSSSKVSRYTACAGEPTGAC